jgi:LysM repeat protein
MSIDVNNVGFIDRLFDERLGVEYVYGGVYRPDPDTEQGCDCSGLVGLVLECYTKGPEAMSWAHNVSTESWGYDYNTGTPAPPGTVGPYGTIAIASPADMPDDAALLICIYHGGGGEDSHTNCLTGPAITPTALAAPAGKIMESNGGPTSYPSGTGTCTNGTGGTPADDSLWTDWHYLPGPITGVLAPQPPAPPAPAPGSTYTVQDGDSLSHIAEDHGVTLAALEAANPGIANDDDIFPGEQINIP